MSLIRRLIRIARAVLESVIGQMLQQINLMDDQVLNPMQRLTQEVAGGSIWKGRGADKFVEEISGVATPQLQNIIQGISQYRGNIVDAANILDDADQQAARQFENLASTFEQI